MNLRLLIAFLFLASAALPQLTEEQLARVDHLEHRLKAPCCWQGNLADHRSEVALQMKAEIRQMVAAGKTDREILDGYKEQYGMRVWVEPEGGLFVVMNVVPVVFLVLGLIAAILILRRWMKPLPEEPAGQNT